MGLVDVFQEEFNSDNQAFQKKFEMVEQYQLMLG